MSNNVLNIKHTISALVDAKIANRQKINDLKSEKADIEYKLLNLREQLYRIGGCDHKNQKLIRKTRFCSFKGEHFTTRVCKICNEEII